MISVLLAAIGSFFEEISILIGKAKVRARQESLPTMGFLQLLWTMIAFSAIALVHPESFRFSWESLPTFLPRAFLEILQAHFAVAAIVKAPRSTFGFIRSATIVLLLGVDMFLGYSISLSQTIGVGVIMLTLLILFMNHGIEKRGAGLTLFTAINAVATSSLYKYNITHYNSVVGEQLPIYGILAVYFFISAYFWHKQNPFRFIRRPIFIVQSISMGIGNGLESFAFMFGPASIILAAKRSSAVLWSIISGNFYFHEKRFALKVGALIFLIGGIVLLVR